MRRWLGIGLMVVVAMMAACTESTEDAAPSRSAARAENAAPSRSVAPAEVEPSIGLKVATIDGGGFSESDADSIRANFLLNAIAPRCGENTEKIADFAVVSRDILRRDYGITTKVAAVLEDMNRSTTGFSNLACAELFTAYVILRGS